MKPNHIIHVLQEFNTLKEEFNEKFYGGEDNDFNGFNNRPLESGNSSEEVQQLKVKYILKFGAKFC